jgi:hypothetical protein
MAYLLRVVLAQAGPAGSRQKWSEVGLKGPLDLDYVIKALTDPEENIWDVMAMDTNLIPLSMVLFHYDEALSFSKGKGGWMSLYPIPEFLAIRMLLIRKIHRGEKIRLGAVIDREELLFSRDLAATPADLEAMNLRQEEWRLVGQVLEREPLLYRYLLSPFLVRSLHQAGAVERDEFVGKMIQRANHRRYPCRWESQHGKNAVRVAILPSMTKGFSNPPGESPPNRYGFRPTEDLLRSLRTLQTEITRCFHGSMKEQGLRTPPGRPGVQGAPAKKGPLNVPADKQVSFCVQDERPLAVYPGCTEEVIRDVCPEADLAVILLGKDVYLALSHEDERPPSGRIGWAYVDLDDVGRGTMEGLCERLAPLFP